MNREIIDLINKSKNIVVFTGAGISTNSGIPDFRGTGGLYETVKEKYGLPYGEAIFDLGFFTNHPEPFFDLSKIFFSQTSLPTKCHRLISSLEEAGKVSLVITQNIDRLHQKAGSKNVMECHGTYDHGHCLGCGKSYVLADYEKAVIAGKIPECECGGVIKPDIVFFGEALPSEFYRLYQNPPQADLILILGTSLKVQPAAQLALMIAQRTESILVNKDKTEFDHLIRYVIHEDLDVFAKFVYKNIFDLKK